MTTTPKTKKPRLTPVVTTDDEVRWYLDTIVRPTVKECVDHQDDVRLAVLAATVVSHLLTDYMATLPPAGGPKLTTDDLLKACPPLRVVHDVCNATKHVRITRYLPDILPETLEAVQSGVMEFTFGLGWNTGPHNVLPGKYRLPAVLVNHKDGGKWLMHGVVQEALWFLEKELP
jgi:hypothetical protein